MPAGVDLELVAIRPAEGGKLVEQQLALEIGRDQIGRAMHDERAHAAVERQRGAQIVERVGRRAAVAPHPLVSNLAVQQPIGPVDAPAEAAVEVGHGGAERRVDGVEDRILVARKGCRRIGIEPRHAGIVGAADALLAAIALAQEGAGIDAAAEPADNVRVQPREPGDLGGDAVHRGRVARALQQVGHVFARRIGLHVGERLAAH